MQCEIKEALCLACEPVAILRTDEKPAGAKQFKPGRWGCVISGNGTQS